MATITPKQKLFVLEYLVDHNAKQAAIRAGYSPKTAEVQGSRLLRNAQVKKFLAGKEKKIEKKLEITAERVKLEIGRIALQSAKDFYDEKGELIPVHLLSDDAAACLAGMDIEEITMDKVVVGYLRKIKRYDKNRALEMLAKHFKLYVDAPVQPISLTISNLSAADLKTLLALKKKATP